MSTYRVRWEVDVDAETHREAAQRALDIQKKPASSATVFDVIEHDGSETLRIDLEELEKVEPAPDEKPSNRVNQEPSLAPVLIQVESEDIHTFVPRFARLAVTPEELSKRIGERAVLARQHQLLEVLGQDSSIVWESHPEFWRYQVLLCVTPELFWFEGRPTYGRSFRTIALSVEAFGGEVASGRAVFGDVDAEAVAFARS